MSTRQLAGWLKEAIRVGEQRDNLNPSTYKEALHILTSITNKKTTDELAHIINELQRVTQTLTVRESVEQALIHREKLLEQVKTAFEKILAIQKEVYLKREHITVELFTQYFESLIRIAQELIKIETELLKDEQIILKVNEEIKVILDDSNFVLAIDKYINHHENINLTNGQKSQFQHFVSEYKDLLVHEDEIKASIDSLKHDLQELGRMYNRHHTDSVEGRFNDQSIPHFLTDTHKASADIKEHFTDAFNKKVSEQTKQYIQFIESLNTQSAQMLGIIQTIYQHEVSAQQDANQGSQELPSFDYDPSEHLTTSDEPEQAEETSDNNTAVQADEEAAHMQEQESDENSQASEEESARLQAEREVDETLKKRIRELVEKLDDDENTIISLKDKITELQSKTQDEQWSSQMQTYLDSVEESVTHMKAQNTARTEFDHYDSYLKEKEKRSKELEAITSGNKILSFKELLKIQSYNSSITTVSKFNTFSEFQEKWF